MRWTSELAVVWLAVGDRPYADQFAERAQPGTSDYFYYALDALHFVYGQWPLRPGQEPWAYSRDDEVLYSPNQLRELEPQWRAEFERVEAAKYVSAAEETRDVRA